MASQDPSKPRPAGGKHAIETDITGESHVRPDLPDDPRSIRNYVVQDGDSWATIAQKVYGDAGQWKRIRDANRDLVDAHDHLQPGSELRIPVD